jgi:hypothetical protein
MEEMDKLCKLLARCKCGVYLHVNQHRDYFQTVVQKLTELEQEECPSDIEKEVRDKMIKLDTIIDLQFYPDTPNGSYQIYHYSLDAALDMAFNCINE